MNYHRQRYEEDPSNRTDVMRPIFEQAELQDGIWQQIIPNKLKMIIVQPGKGATPRNGQFLRVKQFIYKDDMTLIKQNRSTYIVGRKKMIQGLQYSLALCRQNWKGRIFIDHTLAYGEQSLKYIPAKTNLVFDIQISNISLQPLDSTDYEDKLFIDEIMNRANQGDELCKKGKYQKAKVYFQYAFQRIQSSRCTDIKGYLYNTTKINAKISMNQCTLADIQKQQKWLAQLFNTLDMVMLKTIQLFLLTKDYYNVLLYSRHAMMFGNKLELNPRLLLARAISFLEIGQFKNGIELFNHLHDLYPSEPIYQQHLSRANAKQERCKKIIKQTSANPVLPLTKQNKKKKYEIIRIIPKIYEQDEEMIKIRQASKEQFLIDTTIYDDDEIQ